MSDIRPVVARHQARREDIGDLVTRRPAAPPERLDPFLFINHHGPQTYPPHNRGLPFGPHPHRGFETVTFILEGELAHSDSGGHESVIHAGGVQWMTAGRGLVHAELSPESFKREGGPLEILQLWVNLPARLKLTEPAYRGLEAADIPRVAAAEGKAVIELISGDFGGVKGPVDSIADIAMTVLRLRPGARLDLPVAPERNVFLYVVAGAPRVGGTQVAAHEQVELGAGDTVRIEADADATIIFGHGVPYREPIVAHGPFVMNRPEEIVAAIEDYRAGRLGAL
ncbi:MAG: pirin family protein [Sphingomonadaceae bacterium]|nr:pirin family protein [Sphingomonadaceae bacterium]